MAVTTQRGFNLFKFVEHLRGDVLCRRAVEHTCGSERHFDRLWASIPETIITTDFLAFACAKHESWAYKYVPTTMRVEPAFVRALVNYTETFDPKEDESLPLSDQRYIPDAMLANDREFALDCARKGIDPLGSTSQLYVHDQEIVEEYLKTCYYPKRDVYEKIRASPWHNREWVLRMCRDAPATARFLLEEANGDLHWRSSRLYHVTVYTKRSTETPTLLTSGRGGLQCAVSHASSSWLVRGVRCSPRTSRC